MYKYNTYPKGCSIYKNCSESFGVAFLIHRQLLTKLVLLHRQLLTKRVLIHRKLLTKQLESISVEATLLLTYPMKKANSIH